MYGKKGYKKVEITYKKYQATNKKLREVIDKSTDRRDIYRYYKLVPINKKYWKDN